MNEPKRRAARHSLTGTGLYIALFLGLTALAVTGYWMLLPSSTDKTPTNVTEPPVTTPITAEPVTPAVVEVTVLEKEPEATEPVTPVAPRLIVSPLSGETVAAFSMDELAYSETLADWRTHDGIDIKADAGTQVLAASSGTVLSVADDDLMGTTVVIAHDGGYETTYSNLQSVPTVAPEQYLARRGFHVAAPALLRHKGRRDHRPAGISQVLTKEPIQRIGSFLIFAYRYAVS